MGDLYADGSALPYEVLQNRHELARGDYLMYMALMAAIQAHWKEGLREPPTSMGSQYVVLAAGSFKAVMCL